MIRKADVLERINSLLGKELTKESLHEAIFCEEKHKKILRRFFVGTHTYVDYKINEQDLAESPSFADIVIPGNPYTFRVDIVNTNGKYIVHSEPRISFTYLSSFSKK